MSETNIDFIQRIMGTVSLRDKRITYRRMLKELTDLMAQEEFDTRRRQTPQDIRENVQILTQEVENMKKKQSITDLRMEQLEFNSKLSPFKEKIDKIEGYIKREFLEISQIKSVSYSPIDDGLAIMVIHEIENRVEALNQIQKRVSHIRQAFPEIYFETWILHISEVEADHLKNIKIILQK